MAIRSLRAVSSVLSVLAKAVITAATTWRDITTATAIVILASITNEEKDKS